MNFKPGMHCRIVRSFYPEMIGKECILGRPYGLILLDKKSGLTECGFETNLKHPEGAHIFYGGIYYVGKSQIEPILPEGWKTPHWDQCLWQPEGSEFNDAVVELVRVGREP